MGSWRAVQILKAQLQPRRTREAVFVNKRAPLPIWREKKATRSLELIFEKTAKHQNAGYGMCMEDVKPTSNWGGWCDGPWEKKGGCELKMVRE